MTDVQAVQEAEQAADMLADLCESLVVSWKEIGKQAGGDVPPEAQLSFDVHDARRLLSLPDRPKNLEYAAVYISGELVGAISLLLQAVSTQLRARPLESLTIWPLVRAELEYAGRVAWLLEPLEGSNTGARRVARALLEQVSSMQRERFTAGKLNNKPLVKQLKQARDAALKTIESLFPGDFHIPLDSPKDIEEWKIGGEPMLSLGKANDLFISLNAKTGIALYDSLSDLSHPSIMALARQSVAVEAEGMTFRTYPADAGVLDYQARVGCLILYKAAHHVAGYHGLNTDPLERWAETVPGHWFNSTDNAEN
ncbi:hypothetical protein [Paenarthrobacter nicotinovorans]|uniref:hypothetical protein n=1 Tax=Paenarthrobacter nicotinovorans TaxID=29320 RepID=UPI00047CFB01|nr:hypothetical protein [Paenarthrobacter nicotinovorans]